MAMIVITVPMVHGTYNRQRVAFSEFAFFSYSVSAFQFQQSQLGYKSMQFWVSSLSYCLRFVVDFFLLISGGGTPQKIITLFNII